MLATAMSLACQSLGSPPRTTLLIRDGIDHCIHVGATVASGERVGEHLPNHRIALGFALGTAFVRGSRENLRRRHCHGAAGQARLSRSFLLRAVGTGEEL